MTEGGPAIMPVFPALAPLHSRKHIDFSLPETQTSFLLEVCEGSTLEDAVTVAKVMITMFI